MADRIQAKRRHGPDRTGGVERLAEGYAHDEFDIVAIGRALAGLH